MCGKGYERTKRRAAEAPGARGKERGRVRESDPGVGEARSKGAGEGRTGRERH